MPQFEFATVFWPQLFWLSVVFAVLFFGVVMPTLPKIARVVDERESKVASDLSAAEAAKATADSLAVNYAADIAASQNAARASLSAAKAKATSSGEAALAKANVKIEATLAAAEIALATAKSSALAEIESIAVAASSDIVEKLTGARPSASAAASAVTNAQAQG